MHAPSLATAIPARPGARWAPRVLAAALLCLPACSHETRLVRATLWEGPPECSTCAAHALTLWPGGPATVSLRPDSMYTAQIELDSPDGGGDRCIFKFISGTWEFPSRSFDCQPERSVMRHALDTHRFPTRTPPHKLGLRVSILSSNGQDSFGVLAEQTYDVEWVQ